MKLGVNMKFYTIKIIPLIGISRFLIQAIIVRIQIRVNEI